MKKIKFNNKSASDLFSFAPTFELDLKNAISSNKKENYYLWCFFADKQTRILDIKDGYSYPLGTIYLTLYFKEKDGYAYDFNYCFSISYQKYLSIREYRIDDIEYNGILNEEKMEALCSEMTENLIDEINSDDSKEVENIYRLIKATYNEVSNNLKKGIPVLIEEKDNQVIITLPKK